MHVSRIDLTSSSAARLPFLAVVLAVAIGSGCTGSGGTCSINDDCAASELCLDNACSATCEIDSDCAGGDTCENGVCVSDGTPDPGVGPNVDSGLPEPGVDAGPGVIEPDPDAGDLDAGPGPNDGGDDIDAGPDVDAGLGDDAGPGDNDAGPDDDDGGAGGGDGGLVDAGPGGDGGPAGDGGPQGDGGVVDGGPADGGGPVDAGIDAGVDAGPDDAGVVVPTAPEVTAVVAFGTRTAAAVDTFVFDIDGVDVNSDPASVLISVFNAAGTAIVSDFELNNTVFQLDGNSFSIRVSVSGFTGLNGGPGVRAEIKVRDATLLAAATGFSVDLPGAPVSGSACPVPVVNDAFVPCPLTQVCTGADVGACAASAAAVPTLNPVTNIIRVNDDVDCIAGNPAQPNAVSFVLTGTSQERIVAIVLNGQNLNLGNPSLPPSFNITGSICASDALGNSVTFMVVDEAGRISNSASATIQ